MMEVEFTAYDVLHKALFAARNWSELTAALMLVVAASTTNVVGAKISEEEFRILCRLYGELVGNFAK